MTLTQLTYVLAVAEHLNFSRAAEACHVTQPSLSAQVRKLEDELGLLIFSRDSAGVRVTEAGRAIVDQARQVLREARKISDIKSTLSGEPHGRLRLGVIPTVAPSLLPILLPPLLKKHPGFEIDLVEDHTRALINGLAQDTLDAAILSTPENAPAELIERVLYYEAFFAFAGPGHPFLAKDYVRLSDLKGHNPVLLGETHCLRDQVEALCYRSTNPEQPQRVSLVRGGPDTLILVVEQQRSFTLLPAMTASGLSRERQKRLREFTGPIPYRKISLLSHKSFVRRPLVDALCICLDAHLPSSVQRRKNPRGEIISPRIERFRQG